MELIVPFLSNLTFHTLNSYENFSVTYKFPLKVYRYL